MSRFSPTQTNILDESARDIERGEGYGVELRGATMWREARKLERDGYGWIKGGQPNGSALPGLFFANEDTCRQWNGWEDWA